MEPQMIAADVQLYLRRTDLTDEQRNYAQAVEDLAAYLAGYRPDARLREIMPWVG